MGEVVEERRDSLVDHFSLWRRENEEEIWFVDHSSLWRREMRKRSGLMITFLYGGGRSGRAHAC